MRRREGVCFGVGEIVEATGDGRLGELVGEETVFEIGSVAGGGDICGVMRQGVLAG